VQLENKKEKQMEMGLSLTGPDIFVMEKWRRTTPHPVTVMSAVHGSFDNTARADAVRVIIRLSVFHNAWCGVTERRLREEIRTLHPKQFEPIFEAMQGLLDDGMLEIPRRYKRWYSRWLNYFEPRVICPTKRLLDHIAENS
jgi:hypothetical protein